MRYPIGRFALALLLGGCGAAEKTKDSITGKKSSEDSADASGETPPPAEVPASGYACKRQKTPAELVTTLTQDLFRRGPTTEELARAQDPAFTAASLVDWAMTQPDYDTGLAYFVSNLLRIEQNLKVDPDEDDPEEIALLSDLRLEPVILVQRNKDKPWPYIFTTRDIYCSPRTAALYDFPVDRNISGFVGCKMPPERAGILGMVSVLRAFKSAYYVANANRHRVAMALYLGQGLQLSAKTDGPTGEGRPEPLAACVPEIDTRIADSGLIFGTAAVPKAGSVCAGCHSKYLAPMEPAFLRFGLQGEVLNLADVDNFDQDVLEGIDRQTLKDILEHGNKSCWSPDDPTHPPQNYTGLPGLARLIAGSPKLATALAVQIQQNLVNRSPEQTATDAIVKSYQAGGETLQAALKGFFLSEPYQCAVRDEFGATP